MIVDVAGVRIVVKLIEAQDGRARLGFQAPAEAVIHRAELLGWQEEEEQRE